MDIDKSTLIEMYRRMVRIREFELVAIDLFMRGQVKGAMHAYIGQEASGVGVCMALQKDDLILQRELIQRECLLKFWERKRVTVKEEEGRCILLHLKQAALERSR